MKSFIACFLFAIAISLTSYSQVIKTYSGSFSKGNATYQYFENEQLERIYNGKFSYIEGDSLNRKINSLYISGYYKNDKRDGKWVVVQYGCVNSVFYSNKLILNYSNGLLNGKFSQIFKNYSDVNSKYKFSGSFKDNTILGLFNLNEDRNGNKKSITCFFNKQGFLDSTFSYKNNFTELISTFKNGFQIKCVYRHLSTGKVLRNFDYTKFYSIFLQNYDSAKKSAFINWYAFTKKEPFPGFGHSNYIERAKYDEDFILNDNDSIFVTNEKYIVQYYGIHTFDFYNDYYTYYSFCIVLKMLTVFDIFEVFWGNGGLYLNLNEVVDRGFVKPEITPLKVILVERK